MNTTVVAKTYRSDNIVRDISYCLQILFLNKQYQVPKVLMQDVSEACEASYQYMQSEHQAQLVARLKKEINRQLAAQEYER